VSDKNYFYKKLYFIKWDFLMDFMPENGSVWQWFGFSKNPYDFQALGVNKEDRGLFVGRGNEIPRLAAPIASDYGGITVVEGRVGVGKTSFVNAVQYDEWERKHHALPSFQVLQVQKNTDSVGFILSAFSTCIGSLELVNPHAIDKDKDLKTGKAMVSQMLNSGWSFSGGFAGAQAGVGKSAAPSSPLLPALPAILQTSGKWFDAAKRVGWSKFIVPVNNLDMLDDESIIEFLNITRDYMISFAKKGVWWVLIAKEGFDQMMKGRAHRVSEVFTGTPVKLGPMSLDEVQEAIKVRISKFAVGGHHDKDEPIPSEVVLWLYDLSGGEVRAIFKKLTDLVYDYHAMVPSAKTVPTKIAKSILVSEAARRLQELELRENWISILKKSVTEGGTKLGEFKAHGFKSIPALNYAVQRLCALGLLRKAERGREVLYVPTTDANLAFQMVSSSSNKN
jgi:hypothetical protein